MLKNRLKEDLKKQSSTTKVLESDISVLEKNLKVILPKAYKDFLLEYGRVIFKYDVENSVMAMFENEKKIITLLSVLSPIDVYNIHLGLREDSYYGAEPVIMKSMTPIIEIIGEDEDDYIVMDIESGKIWVSFFGVSEASNRNSFGFIANSFSEFLDKIEDYDKLERLLNPSEEERLASIPKIHLKSRELAPKTGRYQATLPKEHPRAEFLKNSGFDTKRVKEGETVGTFGLSGGDEELIVWVYLGE